MNIPQNLSSKQIQSTQNRAYLGASTHSSSYSSYSNLIADNNRSRIKKETNL